MLITGGTGSFGQAFVRRVLEHSKSGRICIYSRDEYKQAVMRENFNDDRLRFFIGDVRDEQRLKRAMQGVTTVIHAAALKRIEVGFYNPDEMVKTNVLGSMNVIEASREAGLTQGNGIRICVPRTVVLLSTDKAYQPVSAYGQSKALAESLFLAASSQDRYRPTRFVVTRYGNVAHSAGSVIPKWQEIIKNDDEVLVTDPNCTRFYMTMDEAIDLVGDAIAGEDPLYIPTLPAYRLGDLALAMGAKKINITGLPKYEKLHESMSDGNSSETANRLSVSMLQSLLKVGGAPSKV